MTASRAAAGGVLVAGLGGGALIGAAFAAGLERSPALGAGLALLVCVLPLAARYGVEWGLPAAVALVVAFEEFPSGLGEMGEDAVERSTRTAFYAKSLGLGGLYLPDVLILGVLALLLVNDVLRRRLRYPRLDVPGWAILLLMGSMVLSAVISIAGSDPFARVVLRDDSTVLYEMNPRSLVLIGVFQIKNYAMLVLGFVAGLLYLDRRERLGRLLGAFLAGVLLLGVFGLARVAMRPSIIAQSDPLFYDSPSSWFFALVCFYAVLSWAYRLVRPGTTALYVLLSGVLMLFILVSYRRTMWGGMALAGVVVFLALPLAAKVRLAIGGGAMLAVVAGLVLLSPLGGALVERVSARANATTIDDMSTLYRVALFWHFYNDPDQTPFFGYGVTPLWSQVISFGYLRFNLESVHSLYFWLWLRSGPFGALCAAVAFLGMLAYAGRQALVRRDPELKALNICLTAALLIFLFSGVFNPIYGEVRYMLPLGIMFAVWSRVGQFDETVPMPTPMPIGRPRLARSAA